MKSRVHLAERKYGQKSLIAYLDGEKTLNWIVGVIRSNGVRGEELRGIFNSLAQFGDKIRFQQALETCEARAWINALSPDQFGECTYSYLNLYRLDNRVCILSRDFPFHNMERANQ